MFVLKPILKGFAITLTVAVLLIIFGSLAFGQVPNTYTVPPSVDVNQGAELTRTDTNAPGMGGWEEMGRLYDIAAKNVGVDLDSEEYDDLTVRTPPSVMAEYMRLTIAKDEHNRLCVRKWNREVSAQGEELPWDAAIICNEEWWQTLLNPLPQQPSQGEELE